MKIADGRWHHMAAVFAETGGAQINVTFRIKWVTVGTILNRDFLREGVFAGLKEAVARVAGSGASSEDVSIVLEDSLFKPSAVEWEYAMRAYCLINSPPETVLPRVNQLKGAKRLALETAAAVRAVPDMQVAVSPTYFVEDIVADPEDVTLPQVLPAGIAKLWVDGYEGRGAMIYDRVGSPDGADLDNIGLDGQIVIGGGQLGRPIGAQVGRFRMWTVALTPGQLREVRQCTLPDLRELIGGVAPYGLVASYDLRGSFENAVNASDPSSFLNVSGGEVDPMYQYPVQVEVGQEGGAFVKGGVCHYDGCPKGSPSRGCPLKREVRFNSQEKCAEFAAWNFCSQAGQNRGRPAMPHLEGCHAGGPISGLGGPFSWRVNRTTR